MILKRANAQYSAHPQTPLLITKGQVHERGTGIVSSEECRSNMQKELLVDESCDQLQGDDVTGRVLSLLSQ